MFHMKKRTKGAISVFLALIYIWVFVLMCIFVDGGRIRMAQAQAEQIQQLANESMMTYYDQGLYEYYDLFGQGKYTTEEMTVKIQQYMQQALSLDVSGSLEGAMDASWIASLDGDTYFDGYDLTVDQITVGSTLNLGNEEVFKSQVNDAMKYSGPLILANNFLGVLDELYGAKESIATVEECVDAVSGVTDQLNAFQTQLDNIRNQLANYCTDPAAELSTAENSGAAKDQTEYAEKFDKDAKHELSAWDNKIEDAVDDVVDEVEDALNGEEENSEQEDDSAVNEALDKVYKEYEKTIDKVSSNAKTLDTNLGSVIQQAKSLESNLKSKSQELSTKGGQASGSNAQIYNDFGDNIEISRESVHNYVETLEQVRTKVQQLCTKEPTHTAVKKAAKEVTEQLKETKDQQAEGALLVQDETAKNYAAYQLKLFQEIVNALPGLRISAGSEEHLEPVKDEEGTSAEGAVDSSSRFGTVTTRAEADGETVADLHSNEYNRDNAAEKAKEMSGTVSNMCDSFIGSAAGDVMDNLFENAYILGNFRDYVHTYKMTSDQIGKDGCDSVANAKFLNGDEYLTAEQYQNIETTCAEAEYVLFGNTDSRSNVVSAYASIYGMRLALDYISVYMTSQYRQEVLTAAQAAGYFAPVVLVLMPFAFALPRAAADMGMIMQGQTAPLLFTDADDWLKTEFTSGVLLGYSDYMLFLLTAMNQDKKVSRMQDIVQMNMRKLNGDFTLDKALVNTYVQSDCSVKYLFMTQAFVPDQFSLDGRYQFSVATNVSY